MTKERDARSVLPFRGGESAALERLQDFIWNKDLIKNYKNTRNGMIGHDLTLISLQCGEDCAVYWWS